MSTMTSPEVTNNMITRVATPDRSLTPQQILDATGRKQYTTPNVVKSMPAGNGDETAVVFFNLGEWISDDNLEKEYAKRGLKPADAYSLAQVNIDDPAFADNHPNCTHWKDENGKWCCIAFRRWLDERCVNVRRLDRVWLDRWWFAGVPK